MSAFSYINIDKWPRKNAYNFYKDFDDPFFNVTVNLEVGQVLKNCKETNQSFFLSCLHACLKAANEIENFRMRIDNDKLKIYDTVHGGSTLFYEDESFGFAYYNYQNERSAFVDESQNIIDECRAVKSFEPSNERDDLIYFSSLPWIQFTSLKHAFDSHINPSIPRISFGKYVMQDSQTLMPLNVEVNHALMDGFHLARYLELLQIQLNI